MTIPKNVKRAIISTVVLSTTVLFGAASCDDGGVQQRQDQAKQSASRETLEKANLKKKLNLEEDANRIGYVYVMSFGKFVGYYTVKGKISSNGSQVDSEQLPICPYSSSNCFAVDGPQDDGTYGTGDPGIFFFTTEGTMVTTSLDYLYSTQPVANGIDVPKLG